MAETTLPKALVDLVTHLDKADAITPEMVHQYAQLTATQESLIPDLIDLIGEKHFWAVVTHLGGNVLRIPKPQDVLRVINRSTA